MKVLLLLSISLLFSCCYQETVEPFDEGIDISWIETEIHYDDSGNKTGLYVGSPRIDSVDQFILRVYINHEMRSEAHTRGHNFICAYFGSFVFRSPVYSLVVEVETVPQGEKFRELVL